MGKDQGVTIKCYDLIEEDRKPTKFENHYPKTAMLGRVPQFNYKS